MAMVLGSPMTAMIVGIRLRAFRSVFALRRTVLGMSLLANLR